MTHTLVTVQAYVRLPGPYDDMIASQESKAINAGIEVSLRAHSEHLVRVIMISVRRARRQVNVIDLQTQHSTSPRVHVPSNASWVSASPLSYSNVPLSVNA